MKERQTALGNDNMARGPEEFGRWLRAELAWGKGDQSSEYPGDRAPIR